MALASPAHKNSAHQRNDKPGGDTVENIRSFDHAKRLRQDFRRRFVTRSLLIQPPRSVAVDIHQFIGDAECGNVGPNPLRKACRSRIFIL